MKRFKNYFSECRIERNLWLTMLAFFILCVFTCSSCSVSKPIQTKPDFEIEWPDTSYTIIPSDEDLLTPNMKDGRISGISRNGKKYTIVDGHGHKNGYMRTETPPDSSKIGTPLICIDEFRFR